MSTHHEIVREATFDTIKSAVNEMVGIIAPTYGPASNKVIIKKAPYRMVVDDGVQIARDFQLNDPIKNAVIEVVREVLISTNDRVGDATTGAAIIVDQIINEVAKKQSFNGRQVELELKKASKEAVEQLNQSVQKIETKEDLKKAARISFDDDEIATIISDLYFDLGKDAIITLGKSDTLETVVEKSDGLSINAGYISPYMVTNPQRMESEIEKPRILITDYRLTETKDITPIMNKMAEKGVDNLIVIAENVEQKALATLIVNLPHVVNPNTRKAGNFMSVAIPAPKMEDQKVFLEDLAFITGAKFFTESKGDRLENVEVDDLGTAEKIVVKQDKTVIVNPGGDKADISVAITDLRTAIEAEKDKKKKEVLKKRLALFTNTLATIKIGAPTENEQKALKYKVEDAVNAVGAAYRNGVVCGSGLALARLKTSSPILNAALKAPSQQLRKNVGLATEKTLWSRVIGKQEGLSLPIGYAHNVVTDEIGPFMEVGVMDSVDALVAGIESAVSIASILVTSSGMIVEVPNQ